MKDSFERTIDTLRVSVTDRCNLRCYYCYPPRQGDSPASMRLLAFDEITEVVATAIDLGVTRIRLTGGEPLVRPGIADLVARLARLRGIQDLALTTNGVLLHQLALPLAAAGIMRVNVHLDTLDPATYSEITAGGDVRQVLEGLAAARRAGLSPIKLNCVVQSGSEAPDARGVADYARSHGHRVQFIRRMHLESGVFSVVEGGNGGDCHQCNRLRLTSDGGLRPCLFSDLSFDVRGLGARAAFGQAVAAKPRAGTRCQTRRFHAIGG